MTVERPQPPEMPREERDDGPDLTPEDEALLDQAWANVAAGRDRGKN